MLPSRPNAGHVGLPSRSGVRPSDDYDYESKPTSSSSRQGRSIASSAGGITSGPRSRSVGRATGRDREYDSDYDRRPNRPTESTNGSRQVRPQRSLANLPARAGPEKTAPPLPSAPRLSTYSLPDESRAGARRSDYSTSSGASSSGASFLDRMKVRSGETSSRTSLEEDYNDPPKRGAAGRAGAAWQPRKQVVEEEYEEPRRARGGGSRRKDYSKEPLRSSREDYEDEGEPFTAEGHGSSLWATVAAAAGTLTISVSKAWESKIATYIGEETPPGQESRLTRAMKAYHLEKAREPSDLPEWLFDEVERRPPRPNNKTRSNDGPGRDRGRHEQDEEYDEAPPPRSRGLRDIYESAASKTNSPAVPTLGRSRVYGGSVDESSGGSKATNRLKALRDAKRIVASSGESDADRAYDSYEESAREGERPGRRVNRSEDFDVRPSMPRQRVGLPSGPGPARRY